MIVGAVVAEMYRFAEELRRRRASIEQATQRLGTLLQSAQWVGPDRERFVSDWSSKHAPSLLSVMDDLADAATRIVTHARAQEQASQ